MNIAIIPARGGSKRIPRKNIRTFAGRPMIAWPIAAAIESHCFDAVVASTDDPEIAEVAVQMGASVPFVRPVGLADDHGGLIAVVRHAIAALGCEQHDLVCCLYATAAFVQPADLQAGARAFEDPSVDFCLGVTPFRAPIQRALQWEGDRLTMLEPQCYATRSQDLASRLHDAGQFCWGRVSAWQQAENVFLSHCAGVELPLWRAFDIDTEDDWRAAELVHRALQKDAV